jgi:hypothetical protein
MTKRKTAVEKEWYGWEGGSVVVDFGNYWWNFSIDLQEWRVGVYVSPRGRFITLSLLIFSVAYGWRDNLEKATIE